MAVVYPGAGRKVARTVGESTALDVAAAKVLAAAKAEAAKYSDTGAYIRGLEVERVKGPSRVTDRLIVATDPASKSIEFGHLTRKGGDGRTWVDGKYIMINAAAKAAG